MGRERYVVRLKEEERDQLERLIRAYTWEADGFLIQSSCNGAAP